MHLLPDGDVRACCRNPIPLGNITEQRITEIWDGVRRAEMQRLLAADATPSGCENCAAEVATEGRRGSYPEVFDFWVNRLGRARSAHPWPIRMEFNISNRCNLQCIQCSGDLSSSIRIHREGRPALPTVYDDQFFEDIRLFLPHLRHANFAGGEPFLGSENFRVWEAIAEIAPRLSCTINTNATQWNKRVERVLEQGNFSFIFSLDGIHKDTYEAIRIDADLDQVLVNIEKFRAYAARRGTDVNINHCLMPQNFAEFGDLLLYAEERRIKVNVSVVRTPRECSIAYLPQEEIRSIYRTMQAQSADLLPRLRLNASTWNAELNRIRIWAQDGPPPDPDLFQNPESQPVELRPRSGVPLPPVEPIPEAIPTILQLPQQANGAGDAAVAMDDLEAWSDDGHVHVVTVGPGDVVINCSASFLDVLGVQRDPLAGRHIDELQSLVEARFGAISERSILHADDHRIDGHNVLDGVEARTTMVALRDEHGWAERAQIFIALRRA